ncbi:hypothetical protein HY065_01505 [Candidatus Berkelbacteria bacterium]|nr:hypothetical protein [Candidatus Berkelbacteria bacterium]
MKKKPIQKSTKPKQASAQPSTKSLELERIKQMLDSAENQIRQARNLIFQNLYGQKASDLKTSSAAESEVFEGVFDGEAMVAPGNKKYPVPPNYASKSKLVAGDVLKLAILDDGSFVFKQVGPVERKKMIGTLEEIGGRYQVVAEGKRYGVLTASVTYYKARPGDEVTILVPRKEETNFAAVENVITGQENGKRK